MALTIPVYHTQGSTSNQVSFEQLKYFQLLSSWGLHLFYVTQYRNPLQKILATPLGTIEIKLCDVPMCDTVHVRVYVSGDIKSSPIAFMCY